MLLFFVFALVAVAALFIPVARVDAQTPTAATGKIEGQIVNGTKDAKLQNAASLVVTLYSAPAGATVPVTQTTKSDADGKFIFGNLDTNAGTRYLLATAYLGVDYASDVFAFPPAQTTMTQTIAVNDTTTDRSTLNVMQTHLVIEVQPKALSIVQIVQVVNMSDRTVIHAGPHDATLIIPVLAKASAFQFDSPTVESTTLVGEGVVTYTLPFVPGVDQVVFNYTVPFNPPAYDFRLMMPYDATTLRVLLSEVKANVTSQQFGATSLFPTQNGQTFLQTTASNIKAGTEVRATFSNMTGASASALTPGTTPTQTGPDNNTLIMGVVLGVVGIAALGLIGFAVTRRRAAQAEEDEEYADDAEETPAPSDAQRLELLQKLADLDDEFEAGKIAQEEYKQQRDAVKAQLRDLMQTKDAESTE